MPVRHASWSQPGNSKGIGVMIWHRTTALTHLSEMLWRGGKGQQQAVTPITMRLMRLWRLAHRIGRMRPAVS